MRVGFASIFSWRPHVEHMVYLAELVESAGHEVRYLTCDSNLPTCYTRELRPHRSRLSECTACRLGGVRSFKRKHISSLGSVAAGQRAVDTGANWGASSASTIGRFETDEDYRTAEYQNLAQRLNAAADLSYAATKNWIRSQKLDAIVVFNGRMDATRGMIEAGAELGCRVISMERTWFGDGLQLLPDESCLGLSSVDAMNSLWRDRPLTRGQALRAAALVASRFLRNNTKEWRAYNTNAAIRSWPVEHPRHKILLLPGSRNEVWGHPDWADGWQDRTQSYDALIAHLKVAPSDIVLRAHPNWGERIGLRTGEFSERFFRDWADRRGILMIGSTDKTSTLGLIEQADMVVVSGGSAALESGIIGKRIVALCPSNYQTAGMTQEAHDAGELARVPPIEVGLTSEEAHQVTARTLRFCYAAAYRIPQYADYVRCETPTKYRYAKGADPKRIIDLLETGVLQSDDPDYATDSGGEDEVIALIAERRWVDIVSMQPRPAEAEAHQVLRRPMFRLIDELRARMPRGDA